MIKNYDGYVKKVIKAVNGTNNTAFGGLGGFTNWLIDYLLNEDITNLLSINQMIDNHMRNYFKDKKESL